MTHITEEISRCKDFIIRPYQNGDEEAIVEILTTVFPGWGYKENLQHWKWKYIDTPLKYSINVAELNGKIIGVTHDVFLNIKIGTKNVYSQFGADAATHPDYRGMGVYKKIMDLWWIKFKEMKVGFEYSLSLNPIIINDASYRGSFSFPHSVSYMVRIRDIDLHLKMRPMKNSWLMRSGFSALKLLNKVRNGSSSIVNIEKDFIITQKLNFDESIDHFWEKIKDEYCFITEKNLRYLNWRICDLRAGNFIVKQAERNGEALGYIALKLENAGYNEGFIVDLLTLPERLDVASALLGDACRSFDDMGVNVVYYMVVEGHPYQRLSINKGFINSHKTANLICFQKDIEKELEIVKNASPSRVSIGYIDTL